VPGGDGWLRVPGRGGVGQDVLRAPNTITVATVDDFVLFVAAGAAGQSTLPRRQRLKQLRGRRPSSGGRCPWTRRFFAETLSAKVCPPNSWEGRMVLWLAEGCGLNLWLVHPLQFQVTTALCVGALVYHH
jgi:hypothetical protein